MPVEEGNRLVKKGDVLFKVDPTPYQLAVNSLQAQLVGAEGGAEQLREQLKAAVGNTAAIRVANRSRAQAREAEPRARGDRRRQPVRPRAGRGRPARTSKPSSRAAIASEAQVQAQLAAVVDGDIASIAQIKAELANAEWELEQTTTRSPCDCYVINLQLRPGAFVAGMPFNPVMTLVEATGQVVALFNQNELHQVAAGQRGRVRAQDLPRAHHQGARSTRSSGRRARASCPRAARCR